MSFTHLHVHSEYSLLDGACRIKQLVAKAKELGMTSVAVTDHGNVFSAVEFYNEAKKQGIKPIIGCEVYVAPSSRFDKRGREDSPYHLILLCKNEQGYKNLCKLISLGYTEGFYSKPRIDFELLQEYHEGLVCLSGCLVGEVSQKLSQGQYNSAKETVLRYKNLFGDDYYIECQNHLFKEEEEILPLTYRLSAETAVPLVATNDAHYIERSDAMMQKVLMCISTATTVEDPTALSFPTNEFYLKSEVEMRLLFPNHPEAIENTQKIAEKCNFEFEFGVTKLPPFKMQGVEDNEAFLREMAFAGLRKYYGENPSIEVTERLEYELSVVSKMGYVSYYLIVWDFINYAKTNGIPVGPGRGSGAGSLIAYCIGITGVDPIKYNLLFERFLNPERVSMPDFDIDFCIEGRQDVIDYVKHRYGEKNVAQIVTFGTMAAKNAIRDVARAMALPYSFADKAAKAVPFGMSIKEAIEQDKEFKEMYQSSLQMRELCDMAQKVEGMPRHCSTHAAGVVVTENAVYDYVPLMATDGQLITQYTMTVLESLGLLKIDFLGLRNLTVIRDAVENIRKTNPDFTMDNLPLDDPAVYKMLSMGETSGVFQLESGGMTSTIMRLVPEKIEDIIAVIALYRPGPMDSIPTYIQNRHNPEKVVYKHPLLKPILEVTYGCIVYQEQVMQVFRTLAGYSYGRADIVRRAMSKKKHDVLEAERKTFISGCVSNGVEEKLANELFDDMLSFASYAFNKSHAASYAVLAYQTAYLKCHYYKEYMAALISSVMDNASKIAEYTADCAKKRVAVMPPSVNLSGERMLATKEGIRFGLLAIKGLGTAVINVILREREKNGEFKDLYDFISRTYSKELNSRAIESLILSGAFDSFPETRKQMLQGYDLIMNAVYESKSGNLEGQISLFGSDSDSAEVIKIPYAEEFTLEQLLEQEKETLGIYVSGHPLSEYQAVASACNFATSKMLIEEAEEGRLKDGARVSLLAIFGAKKIHTTKSGKQMCFAEVEDALGTLEVIVFPEIYEKTRSLLQTGEKLVITGKISLKDEEEPKILAESIVTAKRFTEELAEKTLYLQLNSTDTEKIGEIRRICKKYAGNGKVLAYLCDIKRTAPIKDANSLEFCHKAIFELCEILGEKNVKFKN